MILQRPQGTREGKPAVRVALVHNYHDSAIPSGEDATVDAEAAALIRAGFEVKVVGAANDDLASGRLSSVRAAATLITGFGASPEAELEDWRPDVIHVHNLFPFVGWRWLRRQPAPIVATAHNFRAMCINGYLFRDGHVCTRCLDGDIWSGVRFGCYRDSRVASIPLAIAGRNGAAADPLLTVARQVLVLSERARGVFLAAGISMEKLRLDHHFIPDSLADGIAEPGDCWLFVGRLTPEKGIDQLIHEWPATEPLRVVGDGPLRSSLEHDAAGKDVRFLGQLSRTAVMAEIRGAFGLVFPSRWYETFGLTYIEALSAGVPTLAFPPNVVAEAVRRDRTGAVALWGATESALLNARADFDGIRAWCRQVFAERYTERAFVERRTELYEDVTS